MSVRMELGDSMHPSHSLAAALTQAADPCFSSHISNIFVKQIRHMHVSSLMGTYGKRKAAALEIDNVTGLI